MAEFVLPLGVLGVVAAGSAGVLFVVLLSANVFAFEAPMFFSSACPFHFPGFVFSSGPLLFPG